MKYIQKKPRVFSEVRESLLLAFPLVAAQVAQSSTSFVDTIMMGLLGSQTIAAGGLGANAFGFLLIFSSVVVSAVSPLVAQAFGARKTDLVGRIVRQGLWLAVILGIPLTLLLWYGKPILLLLGQEPKTVALTETYLRAIAFGFLPGLGFAVLRNFVTALSQPRPVMAIVVCGTIIDLVGNYVLMFGKLGFPALGLAGLGWSSTLSLWFTFIALVIYINTQPQFQVYGVFRHLLQFDSQVFRELLQIGLPMGVLASFEVGMFAVVTILAGTLGTVTLAAHQIALQTASISFTVPLGVSFATTVRVGRMVGQGDAKGARLAGYVGIAIGALFMAVMAILFWAMPVRIVSLYLNIDNPVNAPVVKMATALLGVAAVFQIVDGIQVNAAAALRGLKDTRVPMVIGIVAYWCIGLTSGYLLGLKLGFGGVGLWWGLAIGLLAAAVVLTWRFGTAKLEVPEVPESEFITGEV